MKTRYFNIYDGFYPLSVIRRYITTEPSFIKGFLSFAGLKNRTTENLFTFFSNSGVWFRSGFSRIATDWAELMRRVLAPLRKIVSRELVEHRPDPRVRYTIYWLRDLLECGHESTASLDNGIRDLLNAYTECAAIRARHHRCQECLTLTAKKPVQSVAAVAKAA